MAPGSRPATRDLPEELFGGEVNVPLMHQVVTAQLAGARSGTASTKTRSRGPRWWQEAVASEGDRSRSSRVDP